MGEAERRNRKHISDNSSEVLIRQVQALELATYS